MIEFFEEEKDFPAGALLCIDKELEWTSFDVVKKVKFGIQKKYDLKKLKVGHAGTLDPLASGLVIICTGKATKKIDSYMGQTKEYTCTVRLGETTPSYDLETEVDNTYEYKHITRELIDEKLKEFIGEIDQIPPTYSALKINGVRAYKMARGGQEFEIKSRKILVHEIEVLNFDGQNLELRIVCGKGTYIRSMARDIGLALDSGGFLIALRRIAIGDFRVDDALSVDEFLCKLQEF
jgi:tRNA pseudouridine55 synthase